MSVIPELPERLEVAIDAAREAGRVLLGHIETHGSAEDTVEFKGRRELVTAADRASEQLIVERVRAAFPDDAILAEEGVASPQGRTDRAAEHCWLIDPLDGTTNFVHRHPCYSVSIGVLRSGRPWLGAVHAPALGAGETYYGGAGLGAWRDGHPIRVSRTTELRDALCSTGFAYIRNEPGVNDNLANFGRVVMEARDVRRCGSAALDLAHLAAGVYDAYWELYLAPYDVAAGVALVLGAGGDYADLGSGVDPIFGGEILATNGRLRGAVGAFLDGASVS